MPLYVTNTLTRRKERFEPWEPPDVRMYVCGVNLHGPAHVGHARSYVFFDVVRRHLEWSGYRVRHVQNFTDIEDKIIARAQREGRSLEEIAREYIDRFLQEMDALNVLRAHHYPRATEAIPDMIRIVEGLLQRGHAYVVDGDVYFRVTSDPDYGKLSGRSLEELQAGARVEVDPRKEHPMDFALWKAGKPGEPEWQSPWGPGRPGWHIECSAMAMAYLGPRLDLHGGGEDVIFPHHENELAQSECYTGQPFVKYWLHNAHLRMEGQAERMTRSLGNVVWIEEALARYHPDGIRLFLLSSHYRTPMTWREDVVAGAERAATHLWAAVEAADTLLRRTVPSPYSSNAAAQLREETARVRSLFRAALDDDFDTPKAIAHLHTLAAEVNRITDAIAKQRLEAGRPEDVAEAVAEARDTLRELGGVLGLRLAKPIPASIAHALRRLLAEEAALQEVDTQGPTEVLLDRILDARQRARERRDFATADRIRSRLAELGISVEDYPGGSRWRLRDS